MPVSLSVQITEDQFVNSFLASSHILYPLKKPKIFDVFMDTKWRHWRQERLNYECCLSD